MNTTQIKYDNDIFIRNCIIAILFFAVATRIYLYIFHKDLWLDEAFLALAIYNGSWLNILCGKLDFGQLCPFGVALINKLLATTTSYSEHVIYFLPTVVGIAALMVIVRMARRLDGFLYAFICCALICICTIAIYYSSEFKQYIYEFFFSTMLLSIALDDIRLQNHEAFITFKYPLLMTLALLFSNTSIFISAGIGLTITIYLLCHRKLNLQQTVCTLASRYWLFLLVLPIYYFLYLKNSASEGVYGYWQRFFFPTSLAAWPEYLRTVLLPVATGLFTTIKLTKPLTILIFITSIVGVCRLWRNNRYILLALILPLGFAVLAAFRFYPPGHEGIIGARLSLWALPIFILLAGQGILPFAQWIQHKCSRNTVKVIAIVVVCCLAVYNIITAKRGTGWQQIHSLVSTVSADYKNDDIVILYGGAVPAFRYYQIIDKTDIPYKVIDKESIVDDFLKEKKRAFILYSHYSPEDSLKVKNYLESKGYTIEVITAQGAELQKVTTRSPVSP